MWSEFEPWLADATVALLSTGALSCPTQQPFDTDRERRERRERRTQREAVLCGRARLGFVPEASDFDALVADAETAVVDG